IYVREYKRRAIASDLAGTELRGEGEVEIRGFHLNIIRVSPRARQRTPCTVTNESSVVWE
ncbi:hypothetical protein, partial [Halorubrum halodurans]|uniref:hypothetical protein n=1 Tax=Halorubrum halodurans TaxID=1383851 RepID=UPI001C52CE55